MSTVKQRKVGTSYVLTVPKEFADNGREYEPHVEDSGVIYYVPVHSSEEVFKDLIEKDFHAIAEENFISDQKLMDKFGNYGWGKNR
ncbi:MAG: hypothetical protein LBV19_05725 [Streptococcaceae bacterium]|jgi:hypothetical protein|nr:hypothetical protein [Streptococcaceae bacterium]